jgi:RNA:NAD 2'-phosphotransferase (TPT1/KptA family)
MMACDCIRKQQVEGNCLTSLRALTRYLRHGAEQDAKRGFVKFESLQNHIPPSPATQSEEALRAHTSLDAKDRFVWSQGLGVSATNGHSFFTGQDYARVDTMEQRIAFHSTLLVNANSICNLGIFPRGRTYVHLNTCASDHHMAKPLRKVLGKPHVTFTIDLNRVRDAVWSSNGYVMARWVPPYAIIYATTCCISSDEPTAWLNKDYFRRRIVPYLPYDYVFDLDVFYEDVPSLPLGSRWHLRNDRVFKKAPLQVVDIPTNDELDNQLREHYHIHALGLLHCCCKECDNCANAC